MASADTSTPPAAATAAPRLSALAAALLGALFAAALSRVWTLEDRWFAVAVAGVTMAGVAMAAAGRYAELLLPALFLCIPLASLESWFFFDVVSPDQYGNVVYSGALGIGPVDAVIAGLALSWVARALVSRTAPPWRADAADIWPVALLLVYLASLVEAPLPALGWFSIGFLAKHLFVYAYVSRHLGRRELRWFVAALLAAIALEAVLAVMQSQAGVLEGLARDKGAGSAERQTQYEVPGIESARRAEGTSYDSHALALLLSMMLPVPIVMLFDERRSWAQRAGALAVAGAGTVALVLTFSRSGWLSFALSLAAMLTYMVRHWRSRTVLPALAVVAVPGLLVGVWGASKIIERFSSAPKEIMTTRFEQWSVAADIWLRHPLLGVGVGNYVEALRTQNFGFALELPVHNVLLWVGAESGLLGVIAYFGLVLATLVRLLRLAADRDGEFAPLALALATAILAYLLDGLTDPLFREPTVFMMLWHVIAVSVAMKRLAASGAAPAHS